MFIRFVVPVRDHDSHRLTGVFHAAYQVRDRGLLDLSDTLRCDILLGWFNLHLPIPSRFARSRRPNAPSKAICWFKADAGKYINRVQELVALLERNGVGTQMLRTERPGFLVYEDQFQVAAVPFRDTKA